MRQRTPSFPVYPCDPAGTSFGKSSYPSRFLRTRVPLYAGSVRPDNAVERGFAVMSPGSFCCLLTSYPHTSARTTFESRRGNPAQDASSTASGASHRRPPRTIQPSAPLRMQTLIPVHRAALTRNAPLRRQPAPATERKHNHRCNAAPAPAAFHITSPQKGFPATGRPPKMPRREHACRLPAAGVKWRRRAPQQPAGAASAPFDGGL